MVDIFKKTYLTHTEMGMINTKNIKKDIKQTKNICRFPNKNKKRATFIIKGGK